MILSNIAMWETLRNSADWDFVKMPTLPEISKTQNRLRAESCASLAVTRFPISRMLKKPTSVSHSSTESEIISLDAGSRMDGILALDLWDLVTEVVHSSSNQAQRETQRASEGRLAA